MRAVLMPRSIPALVSALVLILSQACAPSGSTAAASPSPSSRPTVEMTSPPPVSSPSATPDPNPVPVTRGYAVVTSAAGAGKFNISLVTSDAAIAASTTADLRSPFSCGTEAVRALVPLPAVNLSSSRAYFLDGSLNVRFLAPNGATGVATKVPGAPQVISLFAVSPDDKRIAVNVLDYSRLPVTQRLYVEDLAGGGNHVEVYSGSTGSQALWPVGWRSGSLVLAFHASTCGENGALTATVSFHVADPTTGRRLVTIGSDQGRCAMVDPQPSALACTTFANDAQLFDWQGNARQRPSCPDGLGNLSPDGAKLLCGVFSSKNSFVIGLDGSRVDLAGTAGQGGFIDSDHVYLGSSSQQEQARIITLSSNQTLPVALVGGFRGRLPGTLDVGRGT